MKFTRLRAVFKTPDLKSKMLYTIMILLIFRIGVHISVPGVDVATIRNATTGSGAGIFEMMNMFGGGALQNYSIFGLGVGPYITASIVLQLLAMDIVPYFTDLQNGGEVGRKKLSQITRYVTIVLSLLQGYMITMALNSQNPVVDDASFMGFFTIALFMMAGSMFVLWLADQITVKGIGNGTSMIIFAGIVDKVPYSFYKLMEGFFQNSQLGTPLAVALSIGVLILFIALVVFTIYTQQATRKIPVQYANNSTHAKDSSYLPFKINVAGVIPVIFASAIMMAPATVLQFIAPNETTGAIGFFKNLFNYSHPYGLILYVILIMAFTYFYAALQVDAKKLAENLGRNGGYIIGVRPGEETVSYVKTIVNRLNFVGGLSLAIIAAVPVILALVSSTAKSSVYGLGGTGLIIVVGVAIEVVNRIDSMIKVKKERNFIK